MESANLLPMLGEFDTRGRPCDVRYLGRRGAALETFLACVMARFASYRADVMVQRLVGTLWAGVPYTITVGIMSALGRTAYLDQSTITK